MGKRTSEAVVPLDEEREVRVITLEHGEHHDATLYRFDKGTYLQFEPGPSLLGKKVTLYTNYVPADGEGKEQEFVRTQYYTLEWRACERGRAGAALGTVVLVTDDDMCCELRLSRAGSFHYYFVYDGPERGGPQGSGWFGVAPALPMPLDGVMCQTVLTKCLGPLPRWRNTLRVAHEAGYNMIHFTPIQELGESGSSYSLAEQLRVDPRYADPAAGRPPTYEDVEKVVSQMRNEWKMLSICDVVLNHTANETPWLAKHPEATYNCAGCPHLRPAAMLDACLARVTADTAAGALPGVPRRVTTYEQIQAIRQILESERVPALRLHEMFTCDVDVTVQKFYQLVSNKLPSGNAESAPLRLITDPQRRRLAATVDMDLALRKYNVYRAGCHDEQSRVQACCAELRAALLSLNAAAAAEVEGHLRAAIDNCVAGMMYFRLQEDGPKVEEVSETHPLVPRYFIYPGDMTASPEEVEAVVYGEVGRAVAAHNGWVMGADPLADFAAPDQGGRVYLRRELIAWGDSVKLRYGSKPEDSPFLWAHMREYVRRTAAVFDGVRLDNCHSTPLHVAEYMLDNARAVRPELYVVAELFTNSDHVDNVFVNRLGITALIREAQSAWDAHEQGRLVHRFGGRPVGSFLLPSRRAAVPSVARALFMDLTHDNPSPLSKRTVFDILPTAALTAVAACATGSTRGYDELVPHHIHVVDENRLYAEWDESGAGGEGRVCEQDGIMAARRALNRLHVELAATGYSEVYVDQMDPDVVAVTRHNPTTRKSVILVAYTAFSAPDPAYPGRALKPLTFEGQLEEIILEAVLLHKDYKSTGCALVPASIGELGTRYIGGLSAYETRVCRGVPLPQSRVFAAARAGGARTELDWRAVLPGTVVAVRVAPMPEQAEAISTIRETVVALDADRDALTAALAPLRLDEFSTLLYMCDGEEGARGGGMYAVPAHGPLVYAGLQGVISLLDTVAPADDLGHPLCDNLRAGDWLIEYTWKRIEDDARLSPVAARYRAALLPVTRLPRYLVPAYFELVVRALYAAVSRRAVALLSPTTRVRQALALTSVQLAGVVPGAPLPPPSPALPPPASAPSLSAGLPHFATGYMRCWGRDTFIALRGMFILTGRYEDAKNHILGFGACLRHGLIPNLLDGGRNARFNCRDAVWWWLLSIKQYCTEVPDGYSILSAPVSRIFPRDDSEPQPPGAADQLLHDVMQEALDAHFQGRLFRERRAGPQIDAHMTDRGFTVQVGIDPDTGFPFGGNDANCGTWMDKMGSSERAGNRGRPATPRDGSAVELVALAHAAAAWLAAAHAAGRYPHAGLTRLHPDGAVTAWTFAQWADRLRRAFERLFWVPAAPGAADLRPDLVHRRAIYKDSHGASQPWADYQLRCNFVVAMAVSPDLFDPKHAWLALDNVEKLLLGPLGLKTLDPADWAYRGDYDNSNDSTDATVAHGFNYHQGPEWVWPLGFYVRARLAFAPANGQSAKAIAAGYATLAAAVRELRTSPWRGLPELTNASGAYCRDSCRTQAWSSATALEALVDLAAARRARSLAD
ncbi:glycogen debranching enzyme isoform X2 [Aricia agestis]|uniref:glycogen debranching enzyme isoform X2 n=1 Tax=Aricia agestis TaxID=91739 RepID=UPI001C20896A|nr:glycogen debranching enzyme isoform X2 [Aricia agestis]